MEGDTFCPSFDGRVRAFLDPRISTPFDSDIVGISTLFDSDIVGISTPFDSGIVEVSTFLGFEIIPSFDMSISLDSDLV